MNLQAKTQLTNKGNVQVKVQSSISSKSYHFWTEPKIWFALSIAFVVIIVMIYIFANLTSIAHQASKAQASSAIKMVVNATIPKSIFETTFNASTKESTLNNLFESTESSIATELWSLQPQSYLIDTPTCRLIDWPLFDNETRPLYECTECEDRPRCNQNRPPFAIRRVNFTWVQIDIPARSSIFNSRWECYASEIIRTSKDSCRFGPWFGPLKKMNNFAYNVIVRKLNGTVVRLDSVKVTCLHDQLMWKFSRIVPLVQHYRREEANQTKDQQAQVNVILLGIDSTSRLNFMRHMAKTVPFLDEHDFIPLNGYHKVGINSFPNILPILTGHNIDHYCNISNLHCSARGFTFDHLDFVFKHYRNKGYLTTFIEDMPAWGFFSRGGSFIKQQPTDYYLRPTNLAITSELYSACYQELSECEFYWDYLFDSLEAFRARGNQSHWTIMQTSTLTHDYLNNVGFVDKPFHHLLKRLFSAGHQHNTVIFIYSDHHIRYGKSMNTTAHLYEESLPVLYMYVPDSLTLSGHNASQLRDIVRANQNQLTSHFDLHATMLHLLNGQVPQFEPYGRSLLEPIPPNRTCDMAGIPPQFCLCNMYDPIKVTPEVVNYSRQVVTNMNKLNAASGNHCVPLHHVATYQAYKSLIRTDRNESFCQMYFHTKPNKGHYKGMVRLDDQDRVVNVQFFTRVNAVGDQSHCVSDKAIVESCYCWDIYAADRKNEVVNYWKSIHSIFGNHFKIM